MWVSLTGQRINEVAKIPLLKYDEIKNMENIKKIEIVRYIYNMEKAYNMSLKRGVEQNESLMRIF